MQFELMVKSLDEGLLLEVFVSSATGMGTFVLGSGFLDLQLLDFLSKLLGGSLESSELSGLLDLSDSDVGSQKLSSSLSLGIRIQLNEESKILQRILSVDRVFL